MTLKWIPAAALIAVVTSLAACGGSTSQVDPFVAKRVLAFGDETSVLTSDGRKYSVNVLTDSGALDCAEQRIWVQRVAAVYDIVFAECNPDAQAVTNGRMLAQPGARAADLATQIDAFVAAGAVVDGDLATVLVGANDVLELYAQYPDRSEDEILAEARQRGDATAQQVNRLIGLGARVVLATVPDLGLSPFGRAERDANSGVNRAALISRLVDAFNVRMRVGIVNDGRKIGLVLGDEMVQAMDDNPNAFGIDDHTQAVCTRALPDCDTTTLIAGADAEHALWADPTHLAYGGQNRLGNLAASRARDNPF